MALKNAFENISTETGLQRIIYKLQILVDRLPMLSGNNMPVSVTNAPGVVINSGTVSTLSNISQIGGRNADADQYVQMQLPAQSLRSRITVT